MDDHDRRQVRFAGWYWIVAFAAVLALQAVTARRLAPRGISYSEFLQKLRANQVASVQLRETDLVATLKAPEGQGAQTVVTDRLPGIDESPLLSELQQRGVSFSGQVERTSWIETVLLGWLVPFGLLGLVYFFFMRRMGRGGPLSIGGNKARIYDVTQHGRVTFDDVAGVDEAEGELVEVVDFLKTPDKYRSLGARIPKGVLLVGPPGTGKTLLARAVAGEAGVPFFSLSGSEFVEMFVGLGAARMRDLFQQAKERAPCIVFIDELDAIGKSRGGVAALATHDEREQTLNQLLVEMDGFADPRGVIIMAATNRPEVLDPALVRAGRFDRQVLVDRPDLKGREEILRIHARTVTLAPGLELRTVAQRTPGMVGADLARVVNEAALAGARRGSSVVERRDFEEAIDRIQLGLKTSRVMSEEEKRRVAYHECGHALVALSVPNADPVHRITIIPRSIGALGATLQLPTEDRYLVTSEELKDRIAVMLGGRAAEELVCRDISTGAHNDLERATETARQMVTRFGMSAKLGAATYGRAVMSRFLGGELGEERNFSEQTAREIDAEVRAILDEQHGRAREVLAARRDVLEKMGARLLEVETLERPEIEALVGRPVPEAPQSQSAAVPEGAGEYVGTGPRRG